MAYQRLAEVDRNIAQLEQRLTASLAEVDRNIAQLEQMLEMVRGLAARPNGQAYKAQEQQLLELLAEAKALRVRLFTYYA